MVTSQKGINLIKKYEGLRTTAYKAISTETYMTIGYGHYGHDVNPTMVITEQQAEELLKKDLAKFERIVNNYNYVYAFNQNEFDALVSFTFNLGAANLAQLTKNKTRNRDEIRKAWLLYNKAGGRVLNGLVKRRNEELDLFNSKAANNNENKMLRITSMNTGVYKVTASVLNIRCGAGLEYKAVGKLVHNEIVEVSEFYIAGDNLWCKIADNEYVCALYNNNRYLIPYIQSDVRTYSLAKDGEKNLSPHFKVKEFRCKDGSDTVIIDLKLINYLELIRDNFNKPVHVNSGYRTETYNRKIGGATKSQHLLGKAADISISGIDPIEICRFAEELGMNGIGLYNNFAHVDVRDNKSFWESSKQIKRTTFK